jgi:hypothetical protein
VSSDLLDTLTVLLGYPRSSVELWASAGAAAVLLLLILGRACQSMDDPLNGPGGTAGAVLLGVVVLVGGSMVAGRLGLDLPVAALIAILTGLTVLIESKLYGSSVRTLVLAWAVAVGLGMASARIVGVGFDFLELGSQHQQDAAVGHGDAPR